LDSNSNKNNNEKSPYEILGVKEGAAFEDIQKARDIKVKEAGEVLIIKAKIESSFDQLLKGSLKARQSGNDSYEAESASKKEKQINQFKPKRMAIDSLSALARGVSLNAFRQFVIAVTGYTKQEEIAGVFTNTAEEFMGSHSITDSHISTITDTILLLQYVEIKGEMARALNVFKMRGSWHDKRIREFIITNSGPEIRDSFSNFEQIFSGAPHRVVPDQNVQNVFKGLDNN